MNLIGYALTGQDNATFMFEHDDPSVERCKQCGYRLNFQAFNPKYRLRKNGRDWDIAATYDGQLIASRKFKEVCDKNRIPGVLFSSFDDEPGFFHITATQEIEFDPECGKTRFVNRCVTCGNYESIVGPFICFKVAIPLPFGFFRSDLVFASGDEKGPLLIVSLEVHDLLNRSDLKGLEFSPAQGVGA